MVAGHSVRELMDLERVEEDLFRGTVTFTEAHPLYGGQVLAQALSAAGCTVPADRAPHSLHGSFLRKGDASRPTVFRVHRDRDGRSYSGRRVVAVQDGTVILNAICSFQSMEDGPDVQLEAAPVVPAPESGPSIRFSRLVSIEARDPGQPCPDAPWPTRFWARATQDLSGGRLLHAAVLTYLSDVSSGLASLDGAKECSSSSLDHSIWFHRPVRMDDWVLVDLTPVTVSGGRGVYRGAVFDAQGVLVATLAQEALFRAPRPSAARPSAAPARRARTTTEGSRTEISGGT
jgi:acyl-CoA thioesterase II